MISRVKSGALKYNTNRRIDLAQALLFTFRAIAQGLIFEFLISIESDTTTIALIGIGWHFLFHHHLLAIEPLL